MNLNDYQQASERTMNPCSGSQDDNYFLGLLGEGGELVDLLKKKIYHQHVVPRDKLIKEIGDCCWYIAANCTVYNISLLAAQKAGEGFLTTADKRPLHECFDLPALCRLYFRVCVSIDDVRYGDAEDNWQLQLAVLFGGLLRIVTAIGRLNGIDLDEVLTANVEKLKIRYPVAYSSQDSILRIV